MLKILSSLIPFKNSLFKLFKVSPVYSWMLSYYKPYSGLLFLFILGGLIITAVQVSIPKSIQIFIDYIFPAENYRNFWIFIAVIGIAIFIMIVIMLAQNLIGRSLQEKTAMDIQYDVYKQHRVLGVSYFEGRPIGKSLSFLNTEVVSLQNFYKNIFPRLIQALIFSFASIIFMVSISFTLTLIMIPSLLLYYLIGPHFEKKATIGAKEARNNRVLFNQKAYENIISLPEIRAHNAQDWNKRRFLDSLEVFLTSRLKMLWNNYMRGTIRRGSYYIGGILVIIAGINLVEYNLLSVGEMAAFLLYYFNVMHMLTTVITMFTEQKILMVQAEKIFGFMNKEPLVKESSNPIDAKTITGKISIKNVTFKYPKGQDILHNFSLEVEKGQKVALIGKSGNGKSTVLKLLVRFYDPQEGNILFDDIPLNKLKISQLREKIGYVFQETYLFGTSVRDNILFGNPKATEEEVILAAKAAYAHEFIMNLPHGYDTILGERGLKLSGGQKQRISIARMFIKNPTIILLDEATSALDNVSEKEVQLALDNLLIDKTTITVAHRLSTIKNYDKIAVINDGRIVEMGSHLELINSDGLYKGFLIDDELNRKGIV
ncbi:ABC transporter ATP-binding protein [Bacillus subtilis]